MGMFTVPVEISNPWGGRRINRTCGGYGRGLFSDAGIPLKSLGLEPVEQDEFLLANGEIRVYSVGEARFKINGRERTTPVVFGDDGVFLLGAVTLQSFGLVADTNEHRLVPARLLLVGMQPGIIEGTPTH